MATFLDSGSFKFLMVSCRMYFPSIFRFFEQFADNYPDQVKPDCNAQVKPIKLLDRSPPE